MFRIIESIIKENTNEQLDETFVKLIMAISMRSFQRIGTDEALSEMLATVTAERNNRLAAEPARAPREPEMEQRVLDA